MLKIKKGVSMAPFFVAAIGVFCIVGLCVAFMNDKNDAKDVFYAGTLAGRIIVIDAGHGGFDGGAVGADGTREDEINLNIAKKLERRMAASGAEVIMTRNSSNAIADTKKKDMQRRREIISESGADVVISIHLNAHGRSSVHGPVVFYKKDSHQGELLASILQAELNEMAKPKRPFSYKIGDYFILNSGDMPSVIIECGFLSNKEECKLLQTEEYQTALADTITAGTVKYFDDMISNHKLSEY